MSEICQCEDFESRDGIHCGSCELPIFANQSGYTARHGGAALHIAEAEAHALLHLLIVHDDTGERDPDLDGLFDRLRRYVQREPTLVGEEYYSGRYDVEDALESAASFFDEMVDAEEEEDTLGDKPIYARRRDILTMLACSDVPSRYAQQAEALTRSFSVERSALEKSE